MSVWATPLQKVKRNRENVMKIGTLPTPLFFSIFDNFSALIWFLNAEREVDIWYYITKYNVS